MKKIGIIILNWRQPQLTLETIDSVLKINQSDFKYHIYLIDNGSNDNSVIEFKKAIKQNKKISLIISSQNLGFSEGNNLGINQAINDGCQFVLLLNNDVLVHQDFLSNLVEPFYKDSSLGITTPKIYFATGHEFHQKRYTKEELGKVIWAAGGEIDWNNVYGKNTGIDEVDRGQYDNYRDNLEFASNCCILFKSSCLKKTGLMPSDYFMYCEDMDFCQKFIEAKYKIAYVPSSVIWHINSGSTAAGGGAFHDYFLTRNRLIFGFKYTSLRTKFALVRESIRLLFTGTKWQKIGVIDFFRGVKQKGSWQK